MSDLENHTVPPETNESWRAWLMTGARRMPVDKRRLRGANSGLKKILLEGLTGEDENVHRWRDFSGAMVRHAVEDAMRTLPPEDKRVVKLAYFGGYSNRAIAREVGLTKGTVQRRLRRALAAISNHIQHGEELGRRLAYGLMLFFSGRWLSQHAWHAAAVAGAAAVIVAAHPLSGTIELPPAPTTHATQTGQKSGTVVVPVQSPAQVNVSSVPEPVAVPVKLPGLQLPRVKLPIPAPTQARLKNLL